MRANQIQPGPTKSILDPTFRYTASFNTDVRKTFARVRRAQNEGKTSRALAQVSSIVGKVAKAR